MLPVVTIIGLQLGSLLGGAVLTETIFDLAGVGQAVYEAITGRDYVVVQGFTLVIAVGYLVVNLIVDISLRLPRPAGPAVMSDADDRSAPTEADLRRAGSAVDQRRGRRLARTRCGNILRQRNARRRPAILLVLLLFVALFADADRAVSDPDQVLHRRRATASRSRARRASTSSAARPTSRSTSWASTATSATSSAGSCTAPGSRSSSAS